MNNCFDDYSNTVK